MPLYSTQTNASNLSSMVDYVNYATGNLFFKVILIAIFFIAYLTLKTYPTDKAFMGAAWLTFLCAFLVYIPGWISPITLFATIALVGIALAYTVIESKE